jgi:ATP-dependent protease ClpP protease subunit
MSRRNRSEDDEDQIIPNNPILIAREQQVSNTFTVYFDKALENPGDYSQLLSLLASASEDDIFVFRFIGCPGGSLHIALPIYNAIQNTAAQTISVLESHSASAATMLFLACGRAVVQPSATMMIHGASYGAVGHMSYNKSHVEFSDAYLKSLFERIYKGFLTDEEINRLLTTDYDMNLFDTEIIERLKGLNPEANIEVLKAEEPDPVPEQPKPASKRVRKEAKK